MRIHFLSADTGSTRSGSFRFAGSALRPKLMTFVAGMLVVLSGCDLEPVSSPADLSRNGEALFSAGAYSPALRMYKDASDIWGPRDERTLMALGKTLGSDWYRHPTVDLLSPIPAGTDIVFLSAQYANAESFINQRHIDAQSNQTNFLARNGVLVVELADTDRLTGYIAPGMSGHPNYSNPFPCRDVTLAPAAYGPDGVPGSKDDHPFIWGRDRMAGTADDVNSDNIDGESGCYVAHGSLSGRLPADAKILVTAGFGGVEHPVMAEYCHAGGRVIVHTLTSGHQTHKPGGTGASNFLIALMSYIYSDDALCSPREIIVPDNQPPVITPVSGFSGDEGSPIAFSASAESPQGGSLTYSWNFGDGSPAVMGESLMHTYVDDGQYEVTLTVSDAEGLSATMTTSASVANVTPLVNAGHTRSIRSGDTFTLGAEFSDAGSSDRMWEYSIDWDGEVQSGSLAEQGALVRSRRFVRAGRYTVRVSVTDKDGATGLGEVAVDVGYLPVPIDIEPGNTQNKVNLMGQGQGFVTVAVLSTPDIDATAVDIASVLLASVPVARKPNGTYHSQMEDVDRDGRPDLVLMFERDRLKSTGDLTPLTSSLTLQAELADGRQLQGTDRVRPTVAR